MGRGGGAILIEKPTCANEDAKGSVANTNAVRRMERSFIISVVIPNQREKAKLQGKKSQK